MSGGENPKHRVHLANILLVMQEQGLVQPFDHHSHVPIKQRVAPESQVELDEQGTAPVRPRASGRSRRASGIQCYASHHQIYGVCSVIR